jgi:hypothetical protein
MADATDDLEHAARSICPDRQLEDLGSGNWQEITLEGEGLTFSRSVERRLRGPTDHFSRTFGCANLPAVDCDVAARLSAIRSMGLTRNAAHQICSTWRCEDEAICTYVPRSR